jgi:hypothetical protein
MAFLIGGANSLTGGYDIDNSLRLDSASSAYLYRNQVDPTSEGVIYTISVWNKICFPSGQNAVLLAGGYPSGSGASVEETFFTHNVAGTIFWQHASNDATVLGKQTASLQHDVSAWYHFMLSVDTTQGTDTNRLKVYINGENVSADMTGGWPAEDQIHQLNQEFSDSSNQNTHQIGKPTRGSNYSDMYIADFSFVDGLQLAPSNFGETDEDSGIWKPKAPDVSAWGDNGFFLEFKNSAVGTGASDTIGADTSGNDNHFTSSGVAVTDHTTDTPTNSFATMNTLDAGAETTLSEGNLKYAGGTTSGQGPAQVCAGGFGVSNGKWYWEVTKKSNEAMVGILAADHGAAVVGSSNPFGSAFSGESHSIYTSDGNARSGNANTSYGSAINDDDIIGIALDMDNGAIYYSDNGTFMNSGDPTSGASKTGAASNFTAGGTYLLGWIADGGSAASSVYEFNFGNPIVALSSGNADANGYGDFEFAPPSGYYAPCTKNLAEFG